MGRLPKRYSKVVMCVRNPLKRAWSSYKFKKLVSQKSELIWQALPSQFLEMFSDRNNADLLTYLIEEEVSKYPVSLHSSRREILKKEWLNIKNSSFLERIKYEIGFFNSYRFFPIINILEGSFLNFPLRNVSDHIPVQNIWVLDINILAINKNENNSPEIYLAALSLQSHCQRFSMLEILK